MSHKECGLLLRDLLKYVGRMYRGADKSLARPYQFILFDG